MAIRFDNIEAINLLNNQGEQTVALTNDQGIIVSGNVAMASGNATGKFAVKSTGVHASYDFYNNGTSYLNGAVTVDAAFTQTGGGASTFSGDIKQGTRIVLQDDGTIQWGATADYGNLSWDTGYALIYGQSGKGIKFGTNGNTLALTLDTSQNATFAGDVTIVDNLKSTGQNMKFHVNGTHVFNVDVNKNIYPQTHNSTDLGFSSTLAFRQLYLSGDITSSAGATFAGDVALTGSGDKIISAISSDDDATLFLSGAGSGKDTHIVFGNDRNLYLSKSSSTTATSEGTPVLTLGSDSNATFAGSGTFDTTLNVSAPDAGGAPAMTAVINMKGYDQRGVGIKMKDNVNTSVGSTDAEWFVGTGYNSTGFNIGYASDGSQSSYPAQSKLSITTSGNAIFAGAITTGGKLTIGTVDATSTAVTALLLGAGGEVKKRALGSNAFNSTAFSTATGVSDNADVTPSWVPDSDPGYSTLVIGTTASTAMAGNTLSAQDLTDIGNLSGTNTGDQNFSTLGGATRTNYTLKFQPPTSSYAGFQFLDTSGNGAGYFLIRGTSDNDVYTAEGITLVADAGWLTLAQRTTSDKGIKFMTGATSATRMTIANDGDININNSLTVGADLGVNGAIKDSLYKHTGSANWQTKKYVRSVGITGADIGGSWVQLSRVVISSSYEKVTIKYTINGYDDVSSGVEAIDVRYENGSAAQENHQMAWYSTDDNANLFADVRSIRSASNGLSNTYDLYVQMAGDWRDNFTVVAESWTTHGDSASITYITANGSATAPSAGSNDINNSERRWYTENAYMYLGGNRVYTTGDFSTSDFATASHSHSAATTSAAGFMSSTDKTKLDGVASGAEVNVQADWNATSGDAFIQNKPTLGTAAAAATGDFATAAQGTTADAALPKAGGTMTGGLIGTTATFSGLVFTKIYKTISVNIADSYVRVAEIDDTGGMISSTVRVTLTAHGSSHVTTCNAIISVGHSQDILIQSDNLDYTNVTLKVESNSNGKWTLSVKSSSANSTAYKIDIQGLSNNLSITPLPTTSQSGTTLEHTTNFGTNVTGVTTNTPASGGLKHQFGGKMFFTNVDSNTSSTTALVLDGNEVEKRTLGSNAFNSTTIPSGNQIIDWTVDNGSTVIHSGNYTNTTYSVGDGGLTQNNFTDTLKTKLDNIEANATADQTAAQIRTALGTGNNGVIPAAGSAGQFLKHDGTFGTPNYTTNTNTTYSAGSGLDLTSTTFSVEPDLRDGITHVGKDANNYITFDSTNGRIDFYAGGVFVARMESDGDLHVKGDVIAFSNIFA